MSETLLAERDRALTRVAELEAACAAMRECLLPYRDHLQSNAAHAPLTSRTQEKLDRMNAALAHDAGKALLEEVERLRKQLADAEEDNRYGAAELNRLHGEWLKVRDCWVETKRELADAQATVEQLQAKLWKYAECHECGSPTVAGQTTYCNECWCKAQNYIQQLQTTVERRGKLLAEHMDKYRVGLKKPNCNCLGCRTEAELEGQAVTTCSECRYEPVQTDSKRGWHIRLCPRHAAADALLTELEKLGDDLDDTVLQGVKTIIAGQQKKGGKP